MEAVSNSSESRAPSTLPARGAARALDSLWTKAAHKLRPAVAPVALLLVVLHVYLTFASWRYTASTLLVIDMSPSMCLASLALLFFPTNLFIGSSPASSGAPGPSAQVHEGATASESDHGAQPELEVVVASTQPRSAGSSKQAGGGGGPVGALRRVWRKLAQAVDPGHANAPRRDTLAASLLQRHRSYMMAAHHGPRSSMDSNGPSSPWSTSSGPSPFGGVHNNNGAAAAGRMSWRQRLSEARWQPSMSRIMSGQRLHMMETESSASSISTSAASRRRANNQGGYGQGHQGRHQGHHAHHHGGSGPARGRGALGGGGGGGGGGLHGPHHGAHGAHSDLPLVPHSGHLAVDCVRHDTTHPLALQDVDGAVSPQHLLQFGALLGESSAELALSQAGAEGALGASPRCLFGATDDEAHWARGWELIADESCPQRGLHYQAWRRYLRKGLFMYKSRTVFEGVTPVQAAAFYFDVRHKVQWDETCTAMRAIPPPALATAALATAPAAPEAPSPALPPVPTGPQPAMWDEEADAYARSAFLYARTRFPAPMAQREYVYARRVWAKADDGGCYVVSKATEAHPAPPPPGCRAVRVKDFVSGTVIRESSHGGSSRGPCSEVVTVYFEDPHVASGILNLGIRKALWPMVQKLEAAMRAQLATPLAAPRQQATAAALQEACLRPLAAAAAAAVAAAGSVPTAGGSLLAGLPGGLSGLSSTPASSTAVAISSARGPFASVASALLGSGHGAAAGSSGGGGGVGGARGVVRPPLRRCASANGSAHGSSSSSSSSSSSPSPSSPPSPPPSSCGGGVAAAAGARGGASRPELPLHPSASTSALTATSNGAAAAGASTAARALQHSFSARCSSSAAGASTGGAGLVSVPLFLTGHAADDEDGSCSDHQASSAAALGSRRDGASSPTGTNNGAGAPLSAASSALAMIPPSLMEKLTLSWARPSELASGAGRGAAAGGGATAATPASSAASGPLALAVLRHSLRGPALALEATLALVLLVARALCAAVVAVVQAVAGAAQALGRGVALAAAWVRGGASPGGALLAAPGGGGRSGGPRSAVASHPVEVEAVVPEPSLQPHPLQPSSYRGAGRSERARGSLVARLALVAVRAVTLPLAHRVLSRSSSSVGTGATLHQQQQQRRVKWGDATAGPAQQGPDGKAARGGGAGGQGGQGGSLSRSDSLGGSQGTSLAAQHGGRQGGAAGTQASWRESEARVRHWLDPAEAPEYLLGQHAELLQHHMAMQQLRERRQREAALLQQEQQQQQQRQGAHKRVQSGGGGGGGGGVVRPRALVVDGVALTWDRLPAGGALGGRR